jgi:prophage regulatory protein
MTNTLIKELPRPQFYRLPQLKARLCVSGSSIWLWVKKGTFPAPIKLAENTTAWRVEDVDNWVNARIEASLKMRAANDE